MTKLNKPLIVAGVLFFIAQLSLGVFSAFADDPERGPAREWVERAKAANAAYKWSEAISCADKAIQIRADYAEAYNERGIAHYQQDQLEKAIADFDTAVKLKPDFPAAYRTRGLAKADLGLFAGAFEDEDTAIRLSPEDTEAYNNKAALFHRQKLYDNAIAEYGQSLKINSDNFGAYRGRGNSYFRKGEYDRAIQDYGKAVKLNPDDSNLYFFRARAYLGKGEHDLAVQDMKKAALLDPENDKFKQELAKLEAKTVAEEPPETAPADSMMYAVAPEESKESKPSDRKPQTQVEALMPPIGPDEISVVLQGLAIDEAEKQMREYFSSPQFDYFLEAKNVFDVTPKLAGITRSTGKKIKYLIIAGHGDPDPQTTGFGVSVLRGSGLSRRPVQNIEAFGQREIDREQWEFNYKLLTEKRNKLLREWAEDPSRKSEKETKQELEAIEKGLQDTFKALSNVHDVTGVMAQDGVIIMFNCFSGMTEHLAFAKNLGRILFGENGGKMLVHSTQIWISRVPTSSEKDGYSQMAFQTLKKFLGLIMEGYWKRGGEVFTWASFSELTIFPMAPTLTPSVLYVSFKTPYLIANEGATVEIEPAVKGVYDSGAFTYQWAGEAVGKTGAKCKLDIYEPGGKLLKGSVLVTDEKGRKGDATFYIYVQKILADIQLSKTTPAAGSVIDASARVTQGKRPADTYWEWRADGGLGPQQKFGDSIKVKMQSAGELKALLISDDPLLGKGRVLAEASVTINPKGQAKPAPRTDEPKQEKPEKPAGEGAPSTETAPPPAVMAGPLTAVSMDDWLKSFSGELEGDWIPVESSVFSPTAGLRFSREGDSYTGSLVNVTEVRQGGPIQGLREGDEVFRLNRVSPHIYKGQERSSWDGNTRWDDACLAVLGNEVHYGGGYGEEELDSGMTTIAKRADAIAAPSVPPVESKTPTVVLAPSTLAPMQLGETAKIQASVLDAGPGDTPVQYTWSGAGESSGDAVSIEAKNPGKFNVSVSAAGPGRSLGSASLEYEVEPITVKVERTSPATDTIPVGGKAQFRATAISGNGKTIKGLNFQWQPHPEIEFEPFEKSATTTATFRTPGTCRIFAQALMKEGDRYITVGESNEVTVTVANPSWTLGFDRELPLIGQEVKAKVSPDTAKGAPEIDMKEMNFRWELSANAKQTGTSQDDREIIFYLTDAKSARISCLASTKYENENLGGAGRTITAKAYNVTIQGPRARQEFQTWKSNVELGGTSSTGMRKAESPYVVGQEILFSSKIEPAPGKPVSYDWSVSPDDVTLNSNGGSDTSITCRSSASYTVKVTARMDGMEIGSATASVSVSEAPSAGQPGFPGKPVWKLVWESLPSGWIVSNGALLSDRSNVIAGAGERNLVDNPGFSENVYFYFAAEPLPLYKIRAIVEVGPAREQDFSSPEKITARFMDSKGRTTPGFQGTREGQFYGLRAIRYDVGSPKSTQKEWGYFVEIDPARKLWSAVMCHVEAVYSGPRDEGPSKEEQINKRLELEQTVERFLEKHVRIKSEPSGPL